MSTTPELLPTIDLERRDGSLIGVEIAGVVISVHIGSHARVDWQVLDDRLVHPCT